jgi:hypothetical protein
MALPTVPPSDPRSTDPQFAGGLAKINPAGLQEEDLQRIRDITDKGIADLEARYEKPNWFKVAAGFAKPQLGGFLASLGSASEAMAENVEQQRENIAPVTNLKVQRELANTLLGQKINQRDIFNKWQASGRPMDNQTFQSIMSMGADTDIAKSAEKYWTQEKERLTAIGTAREQANVFPDLDASYKNFISQAADPNANPEKAKAARESLDKQLDASRPPQINAATWASMNLEDKAKSVALYAKQQTELGLDQEGKFRLAHDNALPRLKTMETIRNLALGKGMKDVTIQVDGKDVTLNGQQQMERMLGMFGGDNPFEAIARAIADKTSLFQGADGYVRQLIQTPESRARFEELAKLLAAQQVQFAGTLVNPTDAARSVASQSQPGVYNSQRALIGIIDQMAHGERHAIDNYRYILDKSPDARRIGADKTFYDMQGRWADTQQKIARSAPTYDTPWYYRPNGKNDDETPSGQQPQTPAQQPSGAKPPPKAASAQRSDTVVGQDGKTRRRNPDTGRWEVVGQ